MGTTSIRLSSETKARLERRKRENESFEDVIERLLEDDRDLLAGFGTGKGTDRPETTREVYERSRRESKERIGRIADRRDATGAGHDDTETLR